MKPKSEEIKVNGEHKDIICGSCGTKEENVLVNSAEVYFPNRYVYANNKCMPYACKSCGWAYNMILFGENNISGISDLTLLQLPQVLENNTLWEQKKINLASTK